MESKGPDSKGKGGDRVGSNGRSGLTLCIRQITNENWRAQETVLCGDLNRKEIQNRGDICIHTADSLHYTAETNTTL